MVNTSPTPSHRTSFNCITRSNDKQNENASESHVLGNKFFALLLSSKWALRKSFCGCIATLCCSLSNSSALAALSSAASASWVWESWWFRMRHLHLQVAPYLCRHRCHHELHMRHRLSIPPHLSSQSHYRPRSLNHYHHHCPTMFVSSRVHHTTQTLHSEVSVVLISKYHNALQHNNTTKPTKSNQSIHDMWQQLISSQYANPIIEANKSNARYTIHN